MIIIHYKQAIQLNQSYLYIQKLTSSHPTHFTTSHLFIPKKMTPSTSILRQLPRVARTLPKSAATRNFSILASTRSAMATARREIFEANSWTSSQPADWGRVIRHGAGSAMLYVLPLFLFNFPSSLLPHRIQFSSAWMDGWRRVNRNKDVNHS